MSGKGYIDLKNFAPRKTLNKTSDRQGPNVNFVNVLPNICSKYKKTDRGFSLGKMTKRDHKFLIKEQHGELFSSE